MMELYIFDRNLNLLGLIDGFFSLIWVRRYNKAGDFELHVALTENNLKLLQRDNIVSKSDDAEAGFIEYRSLSQDREGKEYLVVKGKFLTGYLARRIIWGTEVLNCTVEEAIRTLIDKNAINPIDISRKIPRLELGVFKGYIETINYQISYENLLEEVENLSIISDLGFRAIVDFEDKKLVFDVYKGKDLTVEQVENPPAIFSNEFENVFEQEYVDSVHNYRNVALVAGEGEGSDRKIKIVGAGQELDRYELFVDAKDVSEKTEDDILIPEDEYLGMLESRGKIKLAEYAELNTFESKVNVKGNLIYKQDFDLGDVVTIVNKKWGVITNTRINEIEEVFEADGKSINVTFGESMPTLIDVIKREVR